MKKEFFISGRRIDLNQDVAKIEQDITDAISLYYTGHSVHYSEKENCATIIIDRNITYYLNGGWLIDIDCSILTGLDSEMFGVDPIGNIAKKYANLGIKIPLVYPSIPYMNNFYVEDKEFCKLYKEMNEDNFGYKIKKLDVFGGDTQLSLTVTFSNQV